MKFRFKAEIDTAMIRESKFGYVNLVARFESRNIFRKPDISWYINSFKHITFSGLGFYFRVEF